MSKEILKGGLEEFKDNELRLSISIALALRLFH